MVCIRCKMAVKDELTKLGLHYTTVELNEAGIMEEISALQLQQFKKALLKSGLELIDDKKSNLIQKIKNVIIELAHYSEEPLPINFSDCLSQKLQYDYTYLANLFSEVQGTTIEHFMIAHKIERVKELLVYITRLEVHLSGENGNKQGQIDKRCMTEARLEGKQPIAVIANGERLYTCRKWRN